MGTIMDDLLKDFRKFAAEVNRKVKLIPDLAGGAPMIAPVAPPPLLGPPPLPVPAGAPRGARGF